MRYRFLALFIMAALLASPAFGEQPNILLIIADDLGVDPIAGYLPEARKANTPNIDALAATGVMFDNAWSAPVCSPTRASILTGKYGLRTNVFNTAELRQLAPGHKSLHSALAETSSGAYASALIGKWHLNRNNADLNYPNELGIPYYAGLIAGTAEDYRSWTLTEGGVQSTSSSYITSKFTDLAIAWIAQQEQPWFTWLAYTAAHTPFHLPPANMHSQGDLADTPQAIAADPLPYFLAMVESLDFEIGRLLASLPPGQLENTVILFVGDNGTASRVIQSPYAGSQGKGTLYQGGINVPLIVSGAGVTRRGVHDSALVNVSDLYATILELAGARAARMHDSYSFANLLQQSADGARKLAYAEYLGDDIDDAWTARDARYKLMQFDQRREFYDLSVDPFEQNNLIGTTLSADASSALAAIESGVAQIIGAPSIDGSYSGSWYNPQRSGEGLLIEIVDSQSPTGVVSFYTYAADNSGDQAWLFGSGPVSGNQIQAELVSTRGARFGSEFDPDNVVRTPWGTLSLSFSSCTSASMSYSSNDPSFGSGSIELVRLTQPLLGVVGECSASTLAP